MSALTTHTFGNQKKGKNKRNKQKEAPTSDRKPRKGKKQDHLKKTSLGPLRQGQRLDTSETKPCSSKEHKHQSIQELPWTSANSGHKPVRPVPPKSVRPISYSRPHPQKPKMQKKCTSSSLTLGIGSRDAMQLFSTFLSPPCCQCMNQGSSLKTCNLELLKYTKFTTRCYTCPNEQVRYSTAS
jgi:hypothetical protein